jgi:tRNA(Leu) C34 or U34 (ribose-2'-O)-methylase TrmL
MQPGTITILGVWEPTWMEPRVERRVWKQTLDSFKADKWAMTGLDSSSWSIPHYYPDMEEMLEAYPGKKTFLIAPDRTESLDLADYQHPEDAIYVFGNTPNSLVKYVSEDDDVVSIHTPHNATLFGHCTLPIVLYDRLLKNGSR